MPVVPTRFVEGDVGVIVEGEGEPGGRIGKRPMLRHFLGIEENQRNMSTTHIKRGITS